MDIARNEGCIFMQLSRKKLQIFSLIFHSIKSINQSIIDSFGVVDLIERTVGTEKKQLEIEERGVKVRLTIVDTPGFNDAVNAEERYLFPLCEIFISEFYRDFTMHKFSTEQYQFRKKF